jgi:galactokinase
VEVLETVTMQPGASIMVVNSMVKHNLVDSEYNVRREACESCAAKLAARHSFVKTLRDVSTELLESEKNILSDIEYRRAKHVVGECERVMQAIELLKTNKISEFGQLWWDSHESSRINFENSTPELDKLVELSHQIPGCLGARLSGGGFGGISIHLVQNDKLDEYKLQISEEYQKYYGSAPQIIICKPGAGAC